MYEEEKKEAAEKFAAQGVMRVGTGWWSCKLDSFLAGAKWMEQKLIKDNKISMKLVIEVDSKWEDPQQALMDVMEVLREKIGKSQRMVSHAPNDRVCELKDADDMTSITIRFNP